MRPAIATVLSARPWETRLADAARRTASVRLVGRAYEPEDLGRMGTVDSIVVGAETAWISQVMIRSWRESGKRVLGIHMPSDTPARRILQAGGADQILPDTATPHEMLHVLQAWGASGPPAHPHSFVTTVTGARGAPGRTTIAVAIARGAGRGTALLDADPLPNVGPILGIGPGPDLEALIDGLRNDTGFVGLMHPEDGMAVLCPQATSPPLMGGLICELATGMRSMFGHVVLETGPPGPDLTRMLRIADRSVLVVDGTPQGIIRAGHLIRGWTAERPKVVLNRVRGDVDDVVRSCRVALGLEPAALIPHLPGDPSRAAGPFLTGLWAE